jgi:hypothetical protein
VTSTQFCIADETRKWAKVVDAPAPSRNKRLARCMNRNARASWSKAGPAATHHAIPTRAMTLALWLEGNEFTTVRHI